MDKKELRQLIAKRFNEKGQLGFPKINVHMGKLQNVGMCAQNVRQSLEEAVNNVEKSLDDVEYGNDRFGVEVVYATKEGLLRYHFIEKYNAAEDSRGLKPHYVYVDDTLGYMSKDMTYYLVKEFTLKDVQGLAMHDVIHTAMDRFIDRLFTKKEREEFNIEYGDI